MGLMRADAGRCYCLDIRHLSMKSLFILGALLLSASPVVAGDFVCLRCDNKAHDRVIDAETAKVIRDFGEIETIGEDNVFKEICKVDIKMANILATIAAVKSAMCRSMLMLR